MSLSLTPEAKMLLDAALNVGPFFSPGHVKEIVEILTGKERGVLNEVWNELVISEIVLQKDYHWSIDQARKEEIEKIIEEDLEQAGVTSDRVTSLIEEKIKTNPEKLSVYVKRFLGAPPSATVVADYEQGVAAISAQDFQNAIAGKGAKWAENLRRRFTGT